IYEYLITIADEAQYFWKGKPTGATVLFFLNRYVSLCWYVVQFASYASVSDGESHGLVASDEQT
ncbi:hypothetical protein BD309DRAFT_865887, partial [Dichomitus squalens]